MRLAYEYFLPLENMLMTDSCPHPSDDRGTMSCRPLNELYPQATFPSILRLAIDIVVTLVLLAAPMMLSFRITLWLMPICIILGGVGILRCWLISHEASHRTLHQNRLLSEALGVLFSVPTLYPFYSLARAHKLHHVHLSIVDKDTTWNPWSRSRYDQAHF